MELLLLSESLKDVVLCWYGRYDRYSPERVEVAVVVLSVGSVSVGADVIGSSSSSLIAVSGSSDPVVSL